MKRLRVGLLGCGGIGARHAAAVGVLKDEMQLVACCGRNESKVREFVMNEPTTKPENVWPKTYSIRSG